MPIRGSTSQLARLVLESWPQEDLRPVTLELFRCLKLGQLDTLSKLLL